MAANWTRHFYVYNLRLYILYNAYIVMQYYKISRTTKITKQFDFKYRHPTLYLFIRSMSKFAFWSRSMKSRNASDNEK